MPTSDEQPAQPSRGRRRSLGRGPGAAPVVRPGGEAEPEPDLMPASVPAPALPEPDSQLSEPELSEPEPEPGLSESGTALDPPVADLDAEAVLAPAAPEADPNPPQNTGSSLAGALEGEPDSQAPENAPEAQVPEAQGVPETQEGQEPQEAPPRQEAPDDGRFTVRLANFEGPFDLLLQLISKHKLDVTEVALSKVTDEFMAYIRAMGPDWDLDQTTEFLVVAATLLDLKAARLLPAAEVEDEADLALLEARDLLFARLLQYRAYKQIADIFSARLEEEARRHPRTVGLEPHHAELLPEVVISIGAEGFAKLAVKAMQPRAKPQVYVDHIHAPLVSVREQAALVVDLLRTVGEASFRTLIEDAGDTLTVVARFLALLELYREKAVALEQEEALGELMVRWTGAEDTQVRVTDEFDQESKPAEGDKSKDKGRDKDKPAPTAPAAEPAPTTPTEEPV
ncbi:segregation/condensation protein A [Streptomyces sp. NA04227]|uniref:segregation/condensation protein A n=1 Tax=Streptomyces sp. NA04227 TaxID=2742136 RepID=UPI001591D55F|nr:segregation/condensation protein A [Streptomyces sp. NA04227]QKW05727.1 segregation/condensation protein A [Streptomyces sp. NA04227]